MKAVYFVCWATGVRNGGNTNGSFFSKETIPQDTDEAKIMHDSMLDNAIATAKKCNAIGSIDDLCIVNIQKL